MSSSSSTPPSSKKYLAQNLPHHFLTVLLLQIQRTFPGSLRPDDRFRLPLCAGNRKKQRHQKKVLLWLSLSYSLSFLLYFKYANFFIQNCNQLLHTHFTDHDLFLPIGISFYTFQSISYLMDVYRKEIPATTNVSDYAFYMTFFPHLVAGPIVRAKDFLPQIFTPEIINAALYKESLFRILTGLLKSSSSPITWANTWISYTNCPPISPVPKTYWACMPTVFRFTSTSQATLILPLVLR